MAIRFKTPSAGHCAQNPDESSSSSRNTLFNTGAAVALILFAVPALGQTPDLGQADSFAIAAETFSNTTAGTVVDGDVCYTTGPGVAPTINGNETTPCPPQVGDDQANALAELNAQSCTSIGAAVALDQISIGGGTPGEFPAGCYSSTGAMSITTGESVTLTGTGLYIFRPGGSLDPAANSAIVLANGACADNVFWAPEGSTTIGANTAFFGNIFRGVADGLSITLGDAASLTGRALAFGSTVTTDNNTIAVPDACPQPGSIIVQKQTDPAGSLQTFTFTGDAAGELIDGEQIVVSNLEAGNYSATEVVPEGWELTDITCDDMDSTGDIGTASANFVLDEGETVTCVFTNTLLAGEFGTITIIKEADPADSGESFSFSGDLGNFELMHGDFVTETLSPGVYSVTETVPQGWQLDSAICDDGSPADAIDLAAGENVICIFNNSQPGGAAFSVPIFSPVGLAVLLLLMLAMAAVVLRPSTRIRNQ